MGSRSIERARPRVDAASVLAVLAAAMGHDPVPANSRFCAGADAQSPEEGLALLGAYVAIEEAAVRQAILDAVIMISGRR